MNAEIETNPIAGMTVFGLQAVDYTVDGVSGKSYSEAVLAAALVEANSLEGEVNAFADLLRARQTKLEELGNVLVVLAKAISSLPVDDQESDDKSEANNALITAHNIMGKYGLSLPLTDGNKITRKNAMTGQNDAEYAIDKEDSDMQQELVSFQSLFSKRDTAFATATKLMKKVQNNASAIIRNLKD